MPLQYRYRIHRYMDRSGQQLEQHYHQLLSNSIRQGQQLSMQNWSTIWRPLTDIFETLEVITVKIELSGMKEEEIEVTLYEDALVISGQRNSDYERNEKLYYHEAQIRYGPFRVEVFIPSPINREAVKARYENGILWVDLPKTVEDKTGNMPKRNIKGSDEIKELSLSVLARLIVEVNDRAFVGKGYSLQTGIPRQTSEDFESVTELMYFDVLLHASENIRLMTEWRKQLLYNPNNLEPQFTEFTFQVVTPGHSSLSLDFFHERRWLRTIRFEFHAIEEQAQIPIPSSEV